MVISGRGEKGIDENTLRWVRKQLARAQVYDARFVFSYLPLHKFSDAHVGSLAQKLRLYELFLDFHRSLDIIEVPYLAWLKCPL